MISIEEAKQLKPGDILYDIELKNPDGSPQWWRVVSKKIWKTKPNAIRIEVKNRLNNISSVTEFDLQYFTLEKEE